MLSESCPVCQSTLSQGLRMWHFACNYCGYETASFKPAINTSDAHKLIDENARETGLRKLRLDNFRKLYNRILITQPSRGKLLDVGCAHGWFLDIAKLDYDVLGIEPDKVVAEKAIKRGLPVCLGYFPDVLAMDERFDVITFNDVIEHMPNISEMLENCCHRLNKNGLLVLNLPCSKGIFYRMSKILNHLGFKDFFERMWQMDLPSPHLHYFNHSNIAELLRRKGFLPLEYGRLSTIRISGLYTRIAYTRKYPKPINIIIYLILVLSVPFLRILPSDIIYIIASRK